MKIRLIYLIGLQLMLTACSIHKIDIQQGNVLTTETVQQVKPGMSRSQVQFILGNPAIQDPFTHDRWDYPFSFKSGIGNNATERYHVTVFFKGDNVERIDSNIPATDTQP
jgi:outer membrane protein assembly factor BamE